MILGLVLIIPIAVVVAGIGTAETGIYRGLQVTSFPCGVLSMVMQHPRQDSRAQLLRVFLFVTVDALKAH